VSRPFDPLIRRILDGELDVAALPPELRREAEAALRLLQAVDRAPVTLPAALDDRVMAAVRQRANRRGSRTWRWMVEPHEVRVRVRRWMIGPALAAAAALALLLARPQDPVVAPVAASATTDSVLVRFVLYAPDARQVTLAGTFNEWDPEGTPLVRATTVETAEAGGGIWTTTIALPSGQHQYAFVIDGQRWIADPAAPHVDDGFGRTNSVLSIDLGGRTL
jgi:hypothetical protein